ncbi:MAG: hypothetical protein N2663_05760 [Chlorobi bacterium]|nr:hypothetical protein [Chlorobiota bacterium]
MNRSISIVAVWVLAVGLATAQVRTNFLLLDSMVAYAVHELAPSVRCDTIAVVPYRSVARWLVVEKWMAMGKTVADDARCVVAIADCAVRYALHPTQRDMLVRTITVDLRALGPEETYRTTYQHTDTLAREEILRVELPRSELTSSPVPSPPRSLWDDVLEPVIVVASVATTLLLLFTARSR